MKKKGLFCMFVIALILLFWANNGVADPILASPAWTYESNQSSSSLGTSVATAGDVNGDGFDDVIVGAPFYYSSGSGSTGAVFVFHGSATGLSTTPDRIIESDQADANSHFGFSVASGNVNGDSYSDVIVGAPFWSDTASSQTGKVFVYLGSAAGLSATPDWTALPIDEFGSYLGGYFSWFGYSVAAGDLNDDGFDEVIVGAPYYDYDGLIDTEYGDSGAVFVWIGNDSGLVPNGTPANADLLFYIGGYGVSRSFDDIRLGWSVDTLKDPNYYKVIIGAPGYPVYDVPVSRQSGKVFVCKPEWWRLTQGIPVTCAQYYSDNFSGSFGYSAGNAGDIDGDGVDDLIIGDPTADAAYVWLGPLSSNNNASTADVTLTVASSLGNFGLVVGTAGDVNGDGFDDVIVSDRHYEASRFYEGRAHIFMGSSIGLASTPAWSTETTEEDGALLFWQGRALGTAGDVNGDGFSDIIVGAPGYTNGQSSEGQALVWYGGAQTLIVTREGNGGGKVQSNPTGINCLTDCEEDYDFNTVVTLAATPWAWSIFAGWSGACTGTGTCMVTMDAAKSVTATFNLKTYTLSVSKSGTGNGTVTSSPVGIDCGANCEADYLYGVVVTLTATPDEGFMLAGWSGIADCFDGVVRMYADINCTAIFDIQTYTLYIAKVGTGTGTVTSSSTGIDCGSDCEEAYEPDTVVTLTPIPDSGSLFTGWSGDADCSDGEVTMDVSKTCTAAFGLAAGGWEARYNGTGNGNDVAEDIVVDADGYVYVTGRSENDSGNLDYLTVKYDANGNQVWEARYNGPGNGADYARAMAVDGNGNVYVTGGSMGSGTASDYATIKYSQTDSDGDGIPDQVFEEWVARYNGPLDRDDEASDLAIDENGNVYVTGTSFSSASEDYTTVKYAANGSQVWEARYIGIAGRFGYDVANAITVDADGNVYVTGEITEEFDFGALYTDYATIKYRQIDSDGDGIPDQVVQEWVRMYGSSYAFDRARDLAVDADGNVYVTGVSGNDYATVKYDPDGNELWDARYTNGYGAGALAIDVEGNVYVTGSGAGAGSGDYATVKYDADGNQLWEAQYDGPDSGYDFAEDLAVDAGGYVYVTGRSFSTSASYDYATIKYRQIDSDGDGIPDQAIEIWKARYNGTDNGADYAAALAIDDAGIVYVTGNSVGLDSSSDYATIKYTTSPYILTVTTPGTGSGTVTSTDGGIDCGVDCSEDYFSVTDVTLMAVADSGSTFTGWSGHPDCSDGVVTMDAGKTCTATFTLNTQTLTLATAGTGSGSVSGAGTYNYGDTATVSATADTGSTFTGWSGTDSAECTTGSVLMDTNKTCTATFSIVTIPTVERDALIELYNSTDGDNWTDNTNWLGTEGSECTWFGVTCDAGGNNVTGIYLPINNLVGTIPVELGNLTNLRYLYLYSNQLTGSIPVELGNLSNLQYLILSGNQLTGSIPPELGNLTNLVTLNLWSNQLAGPIPVELGNLSNLQYLILSHNQLTGSIPVELGNLVNLQDFRLLGNQLTGPIPAELGNLINLQSLWLNSNQLTGPIPVELGNLINLTTLYLYSNQLTGPIPVELGNLTNLTRLWLSKNQLTGPIPTELGNLTNLTSLWLSSNQLTGPIPVELTYLTALFDNNSHFGLNALYTTDATLRDFLNSKDYSWEATQTIAPANLTASEVLDIDITLTWTSILYTGDTGGYEVYYSETSGVPYTLFEITADKAVTSSTVTGLAPDTTYYFRLRTVTKSHANNQNILYSEYTPEMSSATYSQALTLTVTSDGDGSGAVTSNPAGINCGVDCSKRYGDGIVVTLTATPDAGSLFNGWDGDPDCSDGVVTMDTDKACTATFTLITAPLNLTPGDTAFTDLTPTITSTPFADTGGGVTHVASQWQVGERSNFISDSFQDTTSGDDYNIEYTLPFTFPFFGRSITSISVNTNGLIELLEDGEFCWECDDYDTHSDGDHIDYMDAIFASEDDLTMDYLNVYDHGSYIMFEWFGSTLSDNDSTTYPLHFQVEIHSDGTIKWNFNQMDFLIYNDMYSGIYPNGGTEIDVGYAIDRQSSWSFDPATQTVSEIDFHWDIPKSYFLYDSGETSTDLTSYTIPATANLTYGDAFFWRVRYKLSTGEWTPWSSPTSFTPVPDISIDDVTVPEGDAGTVDAIFTVILSAASGRSITVDYTTADSTATAGSDYVATIGTLTFAPGETTRTVTVAVNGDTLDEANESFFVNLLNPTNATISDNQGVGTIMDDDVTLVVTKAGSGAGTVTSSPVGIDCGVTCTHDYEEGTVVILTATADNSSIFEGWSGDCTGTNTTTQMTMDAGKTCTAMFNLSNSQLPHPYDTNQDWSIGDFELLHAIDVWAAGNLGDFELLDLIDFWAVGCYHWDAGAGKYMTGCL